MAISAALAAAVLIWIAYEQSEVKVEALLALIDHHPVLAPVLFVAVAALSTIFLLPIGAPLNLGAGVIWGTWMGGLLHSFGVVIAAAVSFLFARYVAEKPLQRLLERKNKLWMLKALRGKDWQLIVLTRLNPIMPFSIMNYLFGLTAISFSRYFVATVVSNLPMSLLWAALGASLSDVFLSEDMKSAVINIGLALLAFTVLYIARLLLRARAEER